MLCFNLIVATLCIYFFAQYTPENDPELEELVAAGMDFLLRVEREFNCMGRWVATRSTRKEDHYTQYHASYCAVVGLLANCAFSEVSCVICK